MIAFVRNVIVWRYTDKNGVTRVKGGKGLKDSQHYPPAFGSAIASLYKQHREEVNDNVKKQYAFWNSKIQVP